MYDIEKQSLEAHVELCAERYKGLSDRFDAVDDRLNKMEQMLSEVRISIQKIVDKNSNQWIHARDVVIGILITGMGVLIVKFIL